MSCLHVSAYGLLACLECLRAFFQCVPFYVTSAVQWRAQVDNEAIEGGVFISVVFTGSKKKMKHACSVMLW